MSLDDGLRVLKYDRDVVSMYEAARVNGMRFSSCEAMASCGVTSVAHGVQGQDAITEGRHADFDEQGASEQEMNWEETLEEAKIDAPNNGGIGNTSAPIPDAPLSTPIIPQTSRKKYPRRNIKRPPPSNSPMLRPTAQTDHGPIRPSTPPPTITQWTIRAASTGTTSRFQYFMPTPRAAGVDARRWPLPHFKPPASTNIYHGGSSGSNNSTPNK
ncbi:hypothetical protein PIB30_057665 [Stylosanthes scabra]|uniref:Uncharacterized protein n=1 Tax=Stylosanthes scabra TaxID=79078 RepID=A0ABU6RJP5_9FABA|nr:hypothetical protein [Stylosanthes scabra]